MHLYYVCEVSLCFPPVLKSQQGRASSGMRRGYHVDPWISCSFCPPPPSAPAGGKRATGFIMVLWTRAELSGNGWNNISLSLSLRLPVCLSEQRNTGKMFFIEGQENSNPHHFAYLRYDRCISAAVCVENGPWRTAFALSRGKPNPPDRGPTALTTPSSRDDLQRKAPQSRHTTVLEYGMIPAVRSMILEQHPVSHYFSNQFIRVETYRYSSMGDDVSGWLSRLSEA